MEAVTFLVQFWGWLLTILSLTYLLRGKRLLHGLMQLVQNKAFTPLSGYIALVLGLVSLLLYREWTMDKMVLVTIFGWISLIKGILRIGMPQVVHGTAEWLRSKTGLIYFLLLICLLLGLWLLWG